MTSSSDPISVYSLTLPTIPNIVGGSDLGYKVSTELTSLDVTTIFATNFTTIFTTLPSSDAGSQTAVRNAITNLLDTAKNGILDTTTSRQYYFTKPMLQALELLAQNLDGFGIDINNIQSVSSALLVPWMENADLEEVNGVAQFAVVSNKGIQALVELEYVKTGNELIATKLEDLREALGITNDALSALADLQDLHNQIEIQSRGSLEDIFDFGFLDEGTYIGRDQESGNEPANGSEGIRFLEERWRLVSEQIFKKPIAPSIASLIGSLPIIGDTNWQLPLDTDPAVTAGGITDPTIIYAKLPAGSDPEIIALNAERNAFMERSGFLAHEITEPSMILTASDLASTLQDYPFGNGTFTLDGVLTAFATKVQVGVYYVVPVSAIENISIISPAEPEAGALLKRELMNRFKVQITPTGEYYFPKSLVPLQNFQEPTFSPPVIPNIRGLFEKIRALIVTRENINTQITELEARPDAAQLAADPNSLLSRLKLVRSDIDENFQGADERALNGILENLNLRMRFRNVTTGAFGGSITVETTSSTITIAVRNPAGVITDSTSFTNNLLSTDPTEVNTTIDSIVNGIATLFDTNVTNPDVILDYTSRAVSTDDVMYDLLHGYSDWTVDLLQSLEPDDKINAGSIQKNLQNAISSAEQLNDTQKEEVRRFLFLFEEFYKSATAILSRLTQLIERMAQAIAR